MANFLYKARDMQGTLQTGHVEAGDTNEALSMLQQRGLIVISVTGADEGPVVGTSTIAHRRFHGSAKPEDKILFCQQLSILLEAGVPLLRSLSVVCVQTESRALLAAIEEMKRDIEGGWTFRHALAKHPKVFSSFWVNLVETGEASGHLAKSLMQLSHYLESSQALRSKAITALTYPMILIVASVFAIAVFVLKIIPVFTGIFKSMNVALPPLTQAIVNLSEFSTHYFLVIVALVVGAVYALRRFLETQQGRHLADRLLLQLPVMNLLMISLQLAQFARGLGTLLESGVPILASLEIMERSATNVVYAEAISRTKDAVREGRTMAEPMERTGLFPPMMVQMVQVGEEIGELSKMLDKVARYYEERVSTFLERLSVTFEPIAICFMAVVIGTLVISMFLPIFSLAGSMKA